MNPSGYYRLFSWKKSPFILTTSLDAPIIRRVEEVEGIVDLIEGWHQIIVVSSQIGYGKTTLLNSLIKHKPANIDYLIPFKSKTSVEDLIKDVIEALSPPVEVKKPWYQKLLSEKLLGLGPETVQETKKSGETDGDFIQRKLGDNSLLLAFDDAHLYPEGFFFTLRELNDAVDNLFMIFFGLPELKELVMADQSFGDRIHDEDIIDLRLYSEDELEDIFRARFIWDSVGGKDASPFSDEAIKWLCIQARGNARNLFKLSQKVLDVVIEEDIKEVDERIVEDILGKITPPKKVKKEEIEVSAIDEYDFIRDMSPTQRDILKLLSTKGELTIPEVSNELGKSIRSVNSLIRKLRGMDKGEVKRKPNVEYPLVVLGEKKIIGGRNLQSYKLSDHAYRRLATR